MKTKSFKLSVQKGFSLVELLVVIAVIAIIAAIAIPNIANITQQADSAKNQRNAQNIASVATAAVAAGYTGWSDTTTAQQIYDDLTDADGVVVNAGTSREMSFSISPIPDAGDQTDALAMIVVQAAGTTGLPTINYNPGS